MAEEAENQRQSSLKLITLQTAQYTFSITKAVIALSECIYVTREFRSSALRNMM